MQKKTKQPTQTKKPNKLQNKTQTSCFFVTCSKKTWKERKLVNILENSWYRVMLLLLLDKRLSLPDVRIRPFIWSDKAKSNSESRTYSLLQWPRAPVLAGGGSRFALFSVYSCTYYILLKVCLTWIIYWGGLFKGFAASSVWNKHIMETMMHSAFQQIFLIWWLQ